ncbi:butyrophilin subfamily 2 member A1-like isoform X1 [Prionailurus viverrinus]|uniref:butyrophilin subfamily 2 member A1-like isoform X1 n=1 Tax=Prionailurus viverrinus TaxID=61388 RepID=UPI001FF18170|nr:butyrophilin subfamily 2 member A1-like isoform X1 [Prionailurus viverrinus]
MQLFCVSIKTLLLSVLLPWPGAGQFHVIGPRAPVIAVVGEEAVLSCHLSPSMDAQDMEVTWYRNDLSGLVHQYRTSQDHLEHQIPEYQGRTEFLKDNITKGHVALRIHPIRPSDGGEYGCFFESSTFYSEVQFEMLVTVSGMAPHIHIEPGNNRDIKMTCISTGWFPEPEIQWKDPQGLHLAPASETKRIEENGLFHVESSITMDRSSRTEVSCVIRNLILSVEKVVLVSMADALFPKDSLWAMWLTLVLFLLAVGATICLLLVRARKSKGKLQEECDLLIEQKEEENGKLQEKYAKLEEEKGKLQEKYERIKLLGEEGLKFLRLYAENVTLDQDTAHSNLQITEDKRRVKRVDISWKLPRERNPLNKLFRVLGQQCFFKGRHYWEVSVKNKLNWTLGICKASVCRQGEIMLSPKTGFWTLCFKRSNCYQALENPQITLDLEESPEIIGIFLDYEAGRVSFYNVTNLSHIYTYKNCFSDPLRPYFCPGPNDQGENEYSLTILPLGNIKKPRRRCSI